MPVKVLVIGGSYGGLAAALNLLDLCKGRTAGFSGSRFFSHKESACGKGGSNLPIEIKVVDERDGCCEKYVPSTEH